MIEELLREWGYLAILVVTFLEGESIVILAGAAAQQGIMNAELVALTALCGSFLGDQFYYTIGRYYGTPLLDRRPSLRGKTEWAFRLVRKHETLFILSFRFIYGVRNVSPFVIAMAGVPRIRFMCLNFIAASIWAMAFTSIGYFSSKALERFFGEHQMKVLIGVAAVALVFGVYSFLRGLINKKKAQASTDAIEEPELTETDGSNTPRTG
ncbi:DedA family protein [Haematospirillum jordaniae]|uniref:DedA family protein n=1 Tax=Haematospirillum jordaniae TaxID=1549855 RepID=UPI000AE2F8B1|nr:DedA family protein [Haematospirillum jordaniae]